MRVPARQPKRSRLWLNDGSCVRLRAAGADHVWSYDFVHHRTYDGRAFRMLNVLDEFTRENLAIRVRRRLSSTDAIEVLTDLFLRRGVPAYIRSDNGPELVSAAVRKWIAGVGARTAFIESDPPWENGYIESFNARLRDELLNEEILYTLREAQVLIEAWRRHNNTARPHGSRGYQPPAPKAIILSIWRPGSAPQTGQIDRCTGNTLTSRPDQSVGAGHGRSETISNTLPRISHMTDHESEEAGMRGGNIYVDSEGIVRDGGGRRIVGIEVHSGREPTLDYPTFTDEDGKVDGVDMTVAENRRRLHNEMAGITEDDEKQLKGRISNAKQMQHKVFVFDRHEKDKGKRWKYEAKVGVPLDPNVVHHTPKFPLGSVMVVREGKDPK